MGGGDGSGGTASGESGGRAVAVSDATREAKLKAEGYRKHIKRKGAGTHRLSDGRERRNRRIAKTMARVEHVFGAIAQMGGKLIRTICPVRANLATTLMSTCDNLKRLVYVKVAGVVASDA